MKKEKRYYYFVFGQMFSNAYFDGIECAIEYTKSIMFEGEVFKHDVQKHSPADLLFNYDGWDAYAEITAKEYSLLKNILKAKS